MTVAARLCVELPSTVTAPRTARGALRSLLGRLPSPQGSTDLEVIVSELVTNAVTHGTSPVELTIVAEDGTVMVEVCDGSFEQPDVPATGNGRPGGGRGLVIVEKLSERWGVRRMRRGKCVWAVCRHPDV